MMLRRLVPIALIPALLTTFVPGPVLAMSTSTEVAIGKSNDDQIRQSYTIVTDPLLNQWVNEVGNKLWAQVARRDVPYNIKILDEPRRQLVHDARRLHLRQRRAARLRAVRRRTRRRHRSRDGPQRAPPHGDAAREGAGVEPALRDRVDLLAVRLPVRPTRRRGRDREDVARRRVAGRPVRRLPDVAGRLRSRRDGDVHAASGRRLRRARQFRRQVFRRSSRRAGARLAPRGVQGTRSQGADPGSGARAGPARSRRGPLRDRQHEVPVAAQDRAQRSRCVAARRPGRDRARTTV